MTTPYYEDDLVTLYLGDCREETSWLDADTLAAAKQLRTPVDRRGDG